MRHSISFTLSLALALGPIACSTDAQPGTQGSGGKTNPDGVGGSGGAAGSSAVSGKGGATASGGKSVSGGATATGGTTGAGGAAASGGRTGSGGAATGGTIGVGGAMAAGGGTRNGGSTGAGGRSGTADAGASTGGSGAGGTSGRGGAAGAGGATGTAAGKFSFFVTSLAALRKLSNSQNGFGGDLRYGQANGLAGADKICTEIAESSMAGSSSKVWRAFLSTSTVNAIDRIGTGPWYDRLGRLVANTTTALAASRPSGGDSAIINDLPNETGTPNHNPDGTGKVDNHDTLTGSNMQGKYYGSASSTCSDWTSTSGGSPRVGHSWPGGPSQNWSDAMNAPGCAAGVNLSESGNTGSAVGSAGGYGGFYCFALSP